MSRDVESSDGGEYVAAVAAAAFAIITLEEDGTEKASLTKMRSKEEHNIIIEHGEETKMKSNNEDAMVEPGKVSKRLGGNIYIILHIYFLLYEYRINKKKNECVEGMGLYLLMD